MTGKEKLKREVEINLVKSQLSVMYSGLFLFKEINNKILLYMNYIYEEHGYNNRLQYSMGE